MNCTQFILVLLSIPTFGQTYNSALSDRDVREFITWEIKNLFIVEPNGDITGLRTINKIASPKLDRELLQLFRKHKWEPGTCKGVKVPTRLMVKVVN